jgi:transposase InsO family protein
MCTLLNVSRSGFYKNKGRLVPRKEKHDQVLCNLIYDYHTTFDGILGYRRMALFINRLNHFKHSEGYVRRLMKFLGISARIRRKKVNRSRTKAKHVAENILDRDFTSVAPNEKWLTDITEFSITGTHRKLYLCTILDLYDRSIVAYEMSYSNNTQLVLKTFESALDKNPGAKPLLHSDRGFNYTSNAFAIKLEEADITHSMSRVGKCIDNGPMEGFFGSLKAEMFIGKKFDSLENLKSKVKDYIKLYNEKRFQKNLGGLAPMELRNQFLACA